MRTIVHRSAVVLALTVCAPCASSAQNTPPNTDVFIAPLAMREGQLVAGKPVNITNRPGYDNQPSFTLDSRSILYTSIHEDAQADIYRYDLGSKATRRVTSTPESEYSASVYGRGSRFSAVRVEEDSTQRLWSFRLDGSDPRLVLSGIKPVGYHAWVDSQTVALFVLGKPSSLLVANLKTGRADTIAQDIGRSLSSLPNGGGFSFTQRAPDSSWTLTVVDMRNSIGGRQAAFPMPVAKMPKGADYAVWLSPTVAISAAGGKLLIWSHPTPSDPGKWADLADFSKAGLKNISRVALSPDQKWIAFVAEPATPSR